MKVLKSFLVILLITAGFVSMGQDSQVKPEQLTVETFKEKVFNYEKNPDKWVFEGKEPCLVDFYADWCKPCKIIAPILDTLAEEYKGRVKFYKVNTDQQKELSMLFGIRSIPTVLFCPLDGEPRASQGALRKEMFQQVIDEFLLGIKENKEE